MRWVNFDGKSAGRPAIVAFAALLTLAALADFLVAHHPHFGLDGTFGFAAWFGFAGCVVFVALARLVAAILRRPDGAYDS